VLAAQHFLGFGSVDLLFERSQGAGEVRGDIFPALRPFDQHADVVDLLGEAVAEFQILGKPTLALQRFLRLGLIVPEGRRRDFLFELS
jgi:hypothetical protein